MTDPETATLAETESHLHYYRERAFSAESRCARLERLLRNVLAVTTDDRLVSLPVSLQHEIRSTLDR